MSLRFWKKRSEDQSRRSSVRSRRLRVESLERRELLASDLDAGDTVAIQNMADPFDVDLSGRPAALDALLIANHLNGRPVTGVSLDVDGDGQVTSVDFEGVLYRLNLGTPGAADGPGLAVMSQGEAGGLGGGGKGGGGKVTYQYYLVGNAADKYTSDALGGFALVGGGTDVDEVFRWMGTQAVDGDFVVLRASGTGAYNSYIDGLTNVDSVETLVIPDTASANNDFVAGVISKAEAIFFAGGDQADYVRFWNNTKVETAIYDAIKNNNAVLGGTSAGLAILGEWDFAALNGTITSSEALANPTDSRITLDNTFVSSQECSCTSAPWMSWLNDAITDSHFQQRDRMGRLITFLASLDANDLADIRYRGIGINEQTAVLVDASGVGKMVGNPYSRKLALSAQQRSAYFLKATQPAGSLSASPLNFQDVQVVRANYNPSTGIGDTFNFATWTGGTGTLGYVLDVTAGVVSTDPSGGSIY